MKRCASGSWLPGELRGRGTNIVVLIVVIAAHHSRSPPQSYARLPKLHGETLRVLMAQIKTEGTPPQTYRLRRRPRAGRLKKLSGDVS